MKKVQCGGLTWARIGHDQALRANLAGRRRTHRIDGMVAACGCYRRWRRSVLVIRPIGAHCSVKE